MKRSRGKSSHPPERKSISADTSEIQYTYVIRNNSIGIKQNKTKEKLEEYTWFKEVNKDRGNDVLRPTTLSRGD